jgi:hypothetical protein
VCAAASGFFRAPWADGADFINGFSITLALLVLGAVVARLSTLRPVPVTAWVAVAAFAAVLIAPGLAPGGLNFFRRADAARYLYPNAVLLFLLCAELASGLRLRGGVKSAVAAVIAAVFAISLLSNVRLLVDRAQAYEQAASLTKSKLAGAELALAESRAQIDVASAGVSEDLAGTQLAFVGLPWPLPAGALAAYYTVSDRFGTPAYSRDQLRQVSAPLQRLARLEFRSAIKLNRQSGG